MGKDTKQRHDWWLMVLGLVLALLLAGPARAEPLAPTDKSLSPYFFVKSENADTDQLPLKSTQVKVDISGVIAGVKIIQTYRNQGKTTLEAVYVFPASTRAAVHDLKMTIGQRVIVARIEERRAARKAYEQARARGRTASLLEQQRPNVFQMNVANIRPGDQITVELGYSEIITPREGVYSFVFPTVVGPRYVGQGGESWTHNPYLPSGEPAPATLSLDLTLKSPLPIARLSCPSHRADIQYQGPRRAQVRLPASAQAGTRDFVLDYTLAGDKIQSGLLWHQGEKGRFFLLMVEPPRRVGPRQTLPREYIFVLDVSGSMRGFPLQTSKRLMADLLDNLRPSDRFNILLFAGDSRVLSDDSLPVNQDNLARALAFLDRQQGGGGTRLLPALKRALAMPAREGVSRSIVLITDGYVNVEKDAFQLVRRHLGRANLFVFGIGSSVNRYLLEGLARAGQGEAQVVLNQREAPAKALAFRRYISYPVLRKIQLRGEGFSSLDLEPAVFPDLFARRPLVVVGRYQGPAQGHLVITGQTAQGPFRQVIELEKSAESTTNPALARLWARRRISRLAEGRRLKSGDPRRQQVVELGLKYGLLTDYTSFVAIDTQVRDQGGEPVTVRQPLPLPSGVPNTALAPRSRTMMKAAPAPLLIGSLPPAAAAREAAPYPSRRITLKVLREKGSRPGEPWRSALKELRRRIELCLRGLGTQGDRLKGRLVLEIGRGPQGGLAGLKVVEGRLWGPEKAQRRLRQCLLGRPGEKGLPPAAAPRARVELVLR